MIQIGAHYQLFGTPVVAVAWDADDGSIWVMLHAVATDRPLYRICSDGTLERCAVDDAGYRGWPCDGMVADVLLWNGETDGATG